MFDFLPDSHRSHGSLDMFALCDRPRIAVPRAEVSRLGRAWSAAVRCVRAISVAPMRAVAATPAPAAPAVAAA